MEVVFIPDTSSSSAQNIVRRGTIAMGSVHPLPSLINGENKDSSNNGPSKGVTVMTENKDGITPIVATVDESTTPFNNVVMESNAPMTPMIMQFQPLQQAICIHPHSGSSSSSSSLSNSPSLSSASIPPPPPRRQLSSTPNSGGNDGNGTNGVEMSSIKF